jgi:hypothetical protein
MTNFFKKIFNKKKEDSIERRRGVLLEDGSLLTFTFTIGDRDPEEAPEWVYGTFDKVWDMLEGEGLTRKQVADIVALNVLEVIEEMYKVTGFVECNGKYLKKEGETEH